MVSNDGRESCSIWGRDDCVSNQSYAEWVAELNELIKPCI